ncbi:hypothetical protein BDQ17DRAFT_1244661, partial [Cyathus striatus]
IFLPNFHCELNFIEYFWGAVKQYLREHCDGTFTALQDNLPKALELVPIETTQFRRWEHRMILWMDEYQEGLRAKEAKIKVKQFSSRKYTPIEEFLSQLHQQWMTNITILSNLLPYMEIII